MKVPRKVPRNIYMILKTKKRKKISLRRNHQNFSGLFPLNLNNSSEAIMDINIISFIQNIIHYFLNSYIIIASSCEHGPSIRI